MATTNQNAFRLTVALIVFVLLTFILTITSYLFFKQMMDEHTKSKAADKAASDKSEALVAAQQENQKLRELIGAAEGATVETIEAKLTTLFTSDFSGFNGEAKAYGPLVDWLREEFKRKSGQAKKAEDASAKAAQDVADALKKEKTSTDAAEARVKGIRDEQEKDRAGFDEQRAQHEQQQKTLLGEKEAAEKRADRLESLLSTIDGGARFLSAERRKEFDGKEKAEDRLDLVFQELRRHEETIKRQNDLLATLRVADRPLQETVLAATPKDDRIDGFDGRVINVDERERSVLVSCGSTRGIRPGMILHVYSPDEPRPQIGDRKGVIEVTAVESPSLLRATIRQDSTRSPILSGDGVATSLWAAGASPELVIVGWVNLDDAGGEDRDRLVELVQRAGGRVVESVTPATAMVVDAGRPPAERGGESFLAEARRQKRCLEDARQYGVRVVGIDALLDMLGLSKASLTANRLPATTR